MSEKPVFVVIMAGGQGMRLWPLSRASRPKQFLALTISGRTLLQEAVRRAVELTGSICNVLVTTQTGQADLAREQLPDLPSENLRQRYVRSDPKQNGQPPSCTSVREELKQGLAQWETATPTVKPISAAAGKGKKGRARNELESQ